MGEPGESAWSPDRVVEVSDFDMDAELVKHKDFMAFLNKLDTNGVLTITGDAVTLNDSSKPWTQTYDRPIAGTPEPKQKSDNKTKTSHSFTCLFHVRFQCIV